MTTDMNLTKYRVRWSDALGVAFVEKRHERRVLGVWPIYEWERVSYFPTTREGVEWIIDHSRSNLRKHA